MRRWVLAVLGVCVVIACVVQVAVGTARAQESVRAIHGIVVDTEGRPVPGARVGCRTVGAHVQRPELDDEHPAVAPSLTTAGPDGRFQLRESATSALRLRAFTPKMGLSDVITIEADAADVPGGVASADVPTVTLRLRRLGTIRGVVSLDGTPVGDVDVVPTPSGVLGNGRFGAWLESQIRRNITKSWFHSASDETESSATGPDGTFVLRVEASLPWTLWFGPNTEAPTDVRPRLVRDVRCDGDPLDVRMERGVTLRGNVRREDGSPVELGLVQLDVEATRASTIPFGHARRKAVVTEGAFAFVGLAGGPHRVKVTAIDLATFHLDIPDIAEVRVPLEIRMAPGGRISGRVLVGGNPVRSAMIRCDEDHASSNEEGKFTFAGLRVGLHAIEIVSFDTLDQELNFDRRTIEGVAVRAGAVTELGDIELRPGFPGAPSERRRLLRDMHSERTVRVTGVVTDPSGRPIPGATVAVIDEPELERRLLRHRAGRPSGVAPLGLSVRDGASPDDDPWNATADDGGRPLGVAPRTFRRGVADASGRWETELDTRGEILVRAIAPGFEPTRDTVIADGKSELRLTLTWAAAIRGRVTSQGTPVAGVEVSLIAEDTSAHGAAGTSRDLDALWFGEGATRGWLRAATGPDGTFEAPCRSDDPYIVRFRRDDSDPRAPNVLPALLDGVVGGAVGVNADLAPGLWLRGRVVGPDGAPLPEGRADAVPVTDDGVEREIADPLLETRSTVGWIADGTFTIPTAWAGCHRVTVRIPWYVEELAFVRPSDEGVEIRVVPECRVRGTVVDAGGRPMPASVRVGLETAATEADGSFELTGLRPGRVRITVSPSSPLAAEFESAEIEVRPGAPANAGTVRSPR